LGADSHIHIYEQGGIATVGGVHPRALPNEADGSIDLVAVAAAVRPTDVHFPTSRLLVLENTHNKRGGRVLSVEYMLAARALCDEHALQLHVDGARVFNAAAALGVSVAEVLAPAHTAALCLSKGCVPWGRGAGARHVSGASVQLTPAPPSVFAEGEGWDPLRLRGAASIPHRLLVRLDACG
jgi:threonine aldolase